MLLKVTDRKIAIAFPTSSLIEVSDNKLVAAEELGVENVLLKETPAAAILFDDAVDKVKAPKKLREICTN